MKKMTAIVLLFLGVIITGCGKKAIPAEEAGALLVDRLVYQKNEKEFINDFRDGAELGKQLDQNHEEFEENFLKGLSSSGTDVPKKEAHQLTQELLKQVKKKTSYRVVDFKETKDGADITYYVTGVDLVNAMKEMTRTLVSRAIDNPDQSDEEILESTIEILTDRIKVIKIENDPIEMTIKLKKEKGYWYIPANQEEQVSKLFSAFVSGTEENEELDEALNEVIDEMMNELLDRMYDQPDVKANEKLKDEIDSVIDEEQEAQETAPVEDSSSSSTVESSN